MNIISPSAMAAEVTAADQWLKLYQAKLADKPDPAHKRADQYLLHLALYCLGVLAALRWVSSNTSPPPSQRFLELVINGEQLLDAQRMPGPASASPEQLAQQDGKAYLRLARELGEQRMASALQHLTQAENHLALAAADLSTVLGANNVRRRACELAEQLTFFFSTVSTLADKLRTKAGVQADRDTVQAELAQRASHQTPGRAETERTPAERMP